MKKVLWVNLPKKLKNSGVQIYNDNLKKIILKKIKIHNIRTHYDSKKNKKIISKYILDFFRIKNFYKKKKINFVILPDESYLILGLFLNLLKIKTILIIHDFKPIEIILKLSLIEKIKYFILLPFFYFLNSFHFIITVSETSKRILKKKIYLKKIISIYNLFDIEIYKKKYPVIKNTNKKIILNVSNDLTHKNFFLVLKSIKKLQNILVIKIGKPTIKSLRHKFMKYIKLNKLDVKFIDETKQMMLNSYYQSADCYINPSYHEGFGRTNIEALIYNKPVLCSDILINREILKKNATYVKNFMAPKAWALQLRKILSKKIVKKKFKNNYLFHKNKYRYEKKLLSIFNN